MMKAKGLSREKLSEQLRKNASMLHEEPEFRAYCEAFFGGDPEATVKKDALIKKGYSDETISKAVSEHIESLAADL